MGRIADYLEKTNVQLGASYRISKQSTSRYEKGIEASASYINAHVDEIGIFILVRKHEDADKLRFNAVIGASTTQLFSNLSLAIEFPPDAEIIISSIDHEANISPWVRIAKIYNLVVKWWTPSSDPQDLVLNAENLRPLMSKKTRLVACTHASNVLGTIHDIRAIANEVHKVPGAMVCVDGVAYAPHRELDMKAIGVDFYAFSWYKVMCFMSFKPPSLLTVICRCTALT